MTRIVAGLAATLTFAACAGQEPEPPPADPQPTGGFAADSLIGVALPQQTSDNWELAGSLFTTGLAEAGYVADVQFAEVGVAEQQQQLQAMIANGAEVLIIGPLDGSQLRSQMQQAQAAGITVIAYDRLILNTDAVDYYVTFDPYQVGVLQGESLLAGLAERKGEAPYNIELIAGSPDDANTAVFFDGAMSVLQPKIDDGTLEIPSGQEELSQVVTQGWEAENAQRRMDTILAGSYQDETTLDGVLSPSDTLSRAVLTSTRSANADLPVVTGQDSEVASVASVLAGEQYSTIYKDTRELVAQSIAMIDTLQAGDEPEVNDSDFYDNGVKVVPTYKLEPILVTEANAHDVYADDPVLGPELD